MPDPSHTSLVQIVRRAERDDAAKSPTPLTLTMISKRIPYSISGICRVIQRNKIKPVLTIGTAKFYSAEQAEQIACLMLPNAKSSK